MRQSPTIGVQPLAFGRALSPFLWLPAASSTGAERVDSLFAVILFIAALLALGVFAAIVVFSVRNNRVRARREDDNRPRPGHDVLFEVAGVVLPIALMLGLFVYGLETYIDLRNSPREAIEIQVAAQKGKWVFTYPTGISDATLHAPVDTPVHMVLSSFDVIHSLYIPAFRVKADAVPGRQSELWFRAIEVGEFPLLCAEHCGESYSDMHSSVIVHEPGGYEKWLEIREKETLAKSPAELGKQLYEQQGCSTCHSLDGTSRVGPSFKGLFGREEGLTDGTSAKVDDEYVRESLVEPQAKIVRGYTPAMPTYKGRMKEQDIVALVEYMKTVK